MLTPYIPAHRAACIGIFDSNLGKYFAPEERQEFIDYLDRLGPDDHYFVLLDQGWVVACGGYYVVDGVGALAWGMVDRQAHSQGHGRHLTEYRLEQLRLRKEVEAVKIETSQHTRGFYARQGFEVTQITPDGFGPGLDCVAMTLTLSSSIHHG